VTDEWNSNIRSQLHPPPAADLFIAHNDLADETGAMKNRASLKYTRLLSF
jgi:hypothetical protein